VNRRAAGRSGEHGATCSQAFELMPAQGRELERKDLVLRLGMTPQSRPTSSARLKVAKCIEFAYGSCRTGVFYRFVPGSKLPADRRGQERKLAQGTGAARGAAADGRGALEMST
jgi:hypothetical protein